MTIVTTNPHSWFVATNSKGKKQTVYNNERYLHNYPFGFEINFSDAPKPASNKVTLHNMSKEHRDFYHKGQKCYVAFNWGESQKILGEGFISKIDSNQSDGVNESMDINFTEGTDYSTVSARKLKLKKKEKAHKTKVIKKVIKGHWKNTYSHYTTTEVYKRGKKKGQKHLVHHRKLHKKWVKAKTVNHRVKTRAHKTKQVNLTFRKGKSYKQIIKGIAAQAGIKIYKIDLAKNPIKKKSYTARGKPLTLLKQLVKETGSKWTYIHSKLEIINPKSSKRTWYVIDDKDLIQPPSENESDDSESGKTTYEITIPLVPDITVNSGIKMESKYLKGRFYVKAGQHSSDGTNPQTQCTIVPL